jgi:hypothetical protein
LNLSRVAGVSEAGVPDTRAFRVTGWEVQAYREPHREILGEAKETESLPPRDSQAVRLMYGLRCTRNVGLH